MRRTIFVTVLLINIFDCLLLYLHYYYAGLVLFHDIAFQFYSQYLTKNPNEIEIFREKTQGDKNISQNISQ